MSCINNDCFEIEESLCPTGCDPVVSTDCIFHNVPSTDSSAKLFNIGVTTGSSLKYILKQIDSKLQLLLTTDFTAFNIGNLGKVNNIKEFSEAVSSKITELTDKDIILTNAIGVNTTNLGLLNDALDSVIKINVSSSVVGINSTDELRAVLIKMLSYLENVDNPLELKFEDSSSVRFATSGDKVSASVIISEQVGNSLVELEDGLFTTAPSISSILKAIDENPELKIAFSNLVNKSIPAARFSIMADHNENIKYTNIEGLELTTTARANTLLDLKDVRSISTIPKQGLTITFKGLQQ